MVVGGHEVPGNEGPGQRHDFRRQGEDGAKRVFQADAGTAGVVPQRAELHAAAGEQLLQRRLDVRHAQVAAEMRLGAAGARWFGQAGYGEIRAPEIRSEYLAVEGEGGGDVQGQQLVATEAAGGHGGATIAQVRAGPALCECYFCDMGRTGWESAALVVLFGLVLAAPVRAQQVGPAPPLSAPLLLPSRLPPVPELRLSWPIAPLKFTFIGTEVSGYRNGPLRLFRAESLWLRTPTFQLLTAGSAERAFELDCSVTCQPIVKHTFDVEARLSLPPVVPGVADPHAFLRSSAYYTTQSPRAAGLLSAGLAGAF